MNLISILYISASDLVDCEADDAVHAIVSKARVHNAQHGLTGALLFTGKYFAQVLEGTAEDIDLLMSKIGQDVRHQNLIIVDRSAISERRFPEWGMAYMGPSQFVARHISRLLNDPAPSEKTRAAGWLADLMHEFSKN